MVRPHYTAICQLIWPILSSKMCAKHIHRGRKSKTNWIRPIQGTTIDARVVYGIPWIFVSKESKTLIKRRKTEPHIHICLKVGLEVDRINAYIGIAVSILCLQVKVFIHIFRRKSHKNITHVYEFWFEQSLTHSHAVMCE